MKYIKRTLALLLAVVLVLALSISAFAVDTNGSIKVDNAVVNKTYTLYRKMGKLLRNRSRRPELCHD